jgi:hypothetical protein
MKKPEICEGQKPFKVKKTDKLILIADRMHGKRIRQEIVRIDYKEQLRYFSRFLSNFISDKKKIKLLMDGLHFDFKFSSKHKQELFSAWNVEDKLSNIDFFDNNDNGILYIFMVLHFKRKPKEWWDTDYFRI